MTEIKANIFLRAAANPTCIARPNKESYDGGSAGDAIEHKKKNQILVTSLQSFLPILVASSYVGGGSIFSLEVFCNTTSVVSSKSSLEVFCKVSAVVSTEFGSMIVDWLSNGN